MGCPGGHVRFTKEEFDGVLVSVATLEASIPVELPGGGRPNANYRYAFAEVNGWDVWAFQVALNSPEGDADRRGRVLPARLRGRGHPRTGPPPPHPDGVAGALTQNAIATAEAKTAEVALDPGRPAQGRRRGRVRPPVRRGQWPELER